MAENAWASVRTQIEQNPNPTPMRVDVGDAGMIVKTEGDRKYVAFLIKRYGKDAVQNAVSEVEASGKRPYPSIVSHVLSGNRISSSIGKSLGPNGAWQPFLCDGLRLGIRFWYQEERGEWIKTALADGEISRSWSPQNRAWVLPFGQLHRFLDALADHHDVFPPDVAVRFAEDAKANPQPFVGKHLGVRLSKMPRQTGIVVESQFDAELVRAMRATGVAVWKSGAKAWVLDLSLPRVLEILEEAKIPRDFVAISEGLVDVVERGGEEWTGFIHLGPHSDPMLAESGSGKGQSDGGVILAVPAPMTAIEVDERRIDEVSSKYGLIPHQREGVRHLLKYSSSLLADDMGLGKTRQSIVACLLDGNPTLVICPPSLKANWKNEIEHECGVSPSEVQVLGGGKTPDPTKRWWIANYEIAQSLHDVPFANLIIDEAHYLKEPTSQRTRNVMHLSMRARRIMLLTATPILNREDELWTLLRLSGHRLGMLPPKDFRALHSGSSDARAALKEQIENQWMLRRMKSTSMGIPGKTRIEPRITVSDEAMEEYRRIERDDTLIAFEKLSRYRDWLECNKIPFVIDALQGLQPQDKAIIFANNLETVDRYVEVFGSSCVRITGQESLRARNSAAMAFQTDPSIRFLFTTFKAGGVGLNLTAARYVVLAARPWTPAEMEQAEDRANRIGQKNLVQVIVPTIAGTIDEQFIDLLDNKKEITASVIVGKAVQGVGQAPH